VLCILYIVFYILLLRGALATARHRPQKTHKYIPVALFGIHASKVFDVGTARSPAPASLSVLKKSKIELGAYNTSRLLMSVDKLMSKNIYQIRILAESICDLEYSCYLIIPLGKLIIGGLFDSSCREIFSRMFFR